MGLLDKGSAFECGACGKKFASEKELTQHAGMHIAGQEDDHSSHEHFSCSACGMTFHTDSELSEHGQKYHKM